MAFNPTVSGIAGASDVAFSAKVDGQIVTYDAGWDKWRNQTIPTPALMSLSDVTASTPADGQVLKYNAATSKWVVANDTTGGASDPTMGGDLTGNASNAQIASSAVGSTEIANGAVVGTKLADDAVTEPKLAAANTPTNGHVLSWNGTQFQWVAPQSVSYATLPAGTMITVFKSGGTWPTRPTARTDIAVRWRGAAPGPTIGGSYAVDGVDDWDEI